MKVNVLHHVVIKDGPKERSLLVEGNPHDIADSFAADLVKSGAATLVEEPALPPVVEESAPPEELTPPLEEVRISSKRGK